MHTAFPVAASSIRTLMLSRARASLMKRPLFPGKPQLPINRAGRGAITDDLLIFGSMRTHVQIQGFRWTY